MSAKKLLFLVSGVGVIMNEEGKNAENYFKKFSIPELFPNLPQATNNLLFFYFTAQFGLLSFQRYLISWFKICNFRMQFARDEFHCSHGFYQFSNKNNKSRELAVSITSLQFQLDDQQSLFFGNEWIFSSVLKVFLLCIAGVEKSPFAECQMIMMRVARSDFIFLFNNFNFKIFGVLRDDSTSKLR
jgi:hypothetical protein